MYISDKCPLVLSDLYSYDIVSCYYSILDNINSSVVDNIDPEDKKLRNVIIGKSQSENSCLSSLLSYTTESVIDFIIQKNNITNKDIIIRQKDGIILKNRLSKIDYCLELKFHGIISKLVITINRDKFLYIMNDNVYVKGVRDKPLDCSFYNLFSNIDISTKNNTVKSLSVIRESVYNANNILWFSLPCDDNKYIEIPMKKFGIIKIPLSSISLIDVKDVEKTFLWNDYVWPFCQSILINNIL